MPEQHWTASLTPLLAVGVALLLGRASSGPVVPVCWRRMGGIRWHVWVVAGLERDGCGSHAIYSDWSGSRVGFRGGVFNLGAEGQLYMGALGAVVLAITVRGCPSGGICRWRWSPVRSAVPCGRHSSGSSKSLRRSRGDQHDHDELRCHELVDDLVEQVLADPTASMDRTPAILPTAALPHLFGPDTRLRAGLLIGLAAVALVAWLLDKTTLGFGIHPVINPAAAQYAGMQVARTLVCTMALSGMLCRVSWSRGNSRPVPHPSSNIFDRLRL